MTKIIVTDLHIANTFNCNFQCAHCMLGDTINEEISTEVLETLFKNILVIGALRFYGGESLMHPTSLREILQIIKENDIPLYKLGITTNGSLYTKEIEEILGEYDQYIEKCRTNEPELNIKGEQGNNVDILLSVDTYHEDHLNFLLNTNPKKAKIYIENIDALVESKYFHDFKGLTGVWKIGKAENLEEADGNADNYRNFYYDYSQELMIVSPCINILPDGTLSETNGSITDLKTKFNYGNILETPLPELIRSHYTQCQSYEELGDKQYDETARFNDKYWVLKHKKTI